MIETSGSGIVWVNLSGPWVLPVVSSMFPQESSANAIPAFTVRRAFNSAVN